MKTNKPAVIALILWLLFVASHAFAVFKSPYPLKADAPSEITAVSNGLGGEREIGTANKPKSL